MEKEPKAEEYSTFAEQENQARQEHSFIEPPLTQYGLNAALLVQAAIDVADQAAKLLSQTSFTTEDLEVFMSAVNKMTEQSERNQAGFLSLEEYQEDSAYLRTDKETIEYWDQKARIVLGISPLELMTDDQSFQTYSTYNEDKQKSWRFPHQGWIIQAYG
ncbi:hypothetical protein [Cohnella sp.]|uniref:hypothetical protein n=1 Tax=Cohnella sp. TaxID=1883426 RepID=UPI0035659D56